MNNPNTDGALEDQELDQVVGGTVSLRTSIGVSAVRQTPNDDFGDRIQAGLHAAAAGVAQNGASLVGGMLPGGAIISAAVSSVSNLGGTPTTGGASVAYAATG